MDREFISPILVGRTEGGRPPLLYRLFGVDAGLVVLSGLLFSVGTLLVYTALHGTNHFESLWIRQIIALVFGFFLCVFMALLTPSFIKDISPAAYGISILTLAMVLVFGRVIHGSKSWFILGPVQFQPSELAKFTTVLYISTVAAKAQDQGPILSWSRSLHLLGVVLAPMALILAQNDLSSAISFFFIGLTYSWTLGILSFKTIATMGIFGLGTFLFLLAHITAGLSIPELAGASRMLQGLGFGPGLSTLRAAGWAGGITAFSVTAFFVLKGFFVLPRKTTWFWALGLALCLAGSIAAGWAGSASLQRYQKNRIVSFLFPNADPLGSGYNVMQSKIAIGSGGLIGRGLLLGSQTALGFLPERHTDFAFAAFAEETGFIGAIGVLVLLAVFFWRVTAFVDLARDLWGKLVAVGLLGLWFGEVAVNISYVLGLFPILGIGLPFISYGGTRLVVNGMEIGLLLAVSRSFHVYR